MEEKYVTKYIFWDENLINYELGEMIKLQDSNRLIMFKAAKKIGHNFNLRHPITSLLWYAVTKNDLLIAGYLAKNGGDIYIKDDNGRNLLFLCAYENNVHMLKYFLACDTSNKLVNELYNGMSSLFFVLFFGYFDIAKMMLNTYPKIKLMADRDDIIYFVNMYDDEYEIILEILTSYFTYNDFTEKDIPWLHLIFKQKLEDSLLTLLQNNKQMVNMKHNNLPILCSAIHKCMKKVIDYYVFENIIFSNKIDNHNTFVGVFLNIGLYDICEHLIPKNPYTLKHIDIDKRNVFDNIIGVNIYYDWGIKSQETIIKLLKLVIYYNNKYKLKININNRNDHGFRPLELAIQYEFSDVVKLLIKNGSNIKLPRSDNDINNISHSGISNDPLCYAIQHGRLEIVKILLNHGCALSTFNIKHKKINVNTALVTAIQYNQSNIFDYLITHSRFAHFLEKSEIYKSFLADFSKKINITDPLILQHLFPADYVEFIKKSHNVHKSTLSNIQVFIEDNFIFRKKKLITMRGLKSCIDLIKFIIGIPNGTTFDQQDNLYSKITNLENKIHKYMSHLGFVVKEMLIMLSAIIKFSNINLLIKIFEIAGELYIQRNQDIFINYVDSLKLLIKSDILDTVSDALELYLADQIELTAIVSEEEFRENKIYASLSKLSFPYKVSHYDIFAKILMESKKNKLIETGAGYSILIKETTKPKLIRAHDTRSANSISLLNKVHVEYVILKNNSGSIPQRWFTYYGKNIYSVTKRDDNHIFPFGFDEELQNCKCSYQENLQDRHINTESALKIYFDGYVKCGNAILEGKYEYFIDSQSVLFHRLFVPNK